MQAKVNKITIQLVQADLFALQVDSIVHTTDPNLTINPLLVAKAGPTIEQQTVAIGWCDVGSAIVTDAGQLNGVQKIIHAVAPRWGEGSERGKLANVTWASLSLAEKHELKAIALPAISVGANGYPLENCAVTMLSKIIDFTFESLKHLRTIIICLADDAQYTAFSHEFQRQIESLKDTGEGKVYV
ncbi:O-acetyl-ADP-ribose deacetylase [bacterium]|nr:O-acetyl-ADP-ribose deacetylase [bacterium]